MRTDLFVWKPPAPRDPLVRWSDDAVLAAVASAYGECVDHDYVVTRRPDRHDRVNPEVDGLLEAPGLTPIAIEITAVETFAGQLLDESRVQKLLSSLQADLATKLPSGLWCIIPVRAFAPGFDWHAARTKLSMFLQEISPGLIPGSSSHDVPGVPFRVKLKYDPRLNVPFRIWRGAPPSDQISVNLLRSMETALSHKRDRLTAYKDTGYRTVLVLDGADSELVSWSEPYRAFLAAEEGVGSEHVVDVIFAMTSDPNRIHCLAFKGDLSLRQALNPVNLRFGPEYAAEWSCSGDGSAT